MLKKNFPIVLVSLVIGICFTCCTKDSQVNSPAKVVAPTLPIEITNSIAPNPCDVSFTITTNSTSNQTVKMTDALGRLRLDLTINKTTVINTDSLQMGVYYVQITNSTGTIVHKIIIEH